MERRRDRKDDMLGGSAYSRGREPPFPALASVLVYVTMRIEPAAVRPFVPPQLSLAASGDAQLAIYDAPINWGMGPHRRALIGVEIDEYDSPDTNRGMFIVSQVMTGDRRVMERNYARARAGDVVIAWQGPDVIRSTVSNEAGAWLDLTLRVAGPLMPDNSGIDRYIAQTADGLVQHDLSFTATARECRLERFEFGSAAAREFRACKPVEVHFAGVNPTFAVTYSVPWPLTTSRDNQTIGSYLDLMETDGRAAAVFSVDGRLLRANGKGMALLQQISPSMVGGALKAASGGRPVQLHRTSGPPLLVRANRFRLPRSIDDLILVFLIDLADPGRRAALPFLQLLGLTSAEASIAEMVGSGLSARDAAEALRLSQNTVRSTLKAIYDKLGISKQSELARLLARLQF